MRLFDGFNKVLYRYCFFIWLLMLSACTSAPSVYKVAGAVDNNSAQGFAVHGDMVFLANNGGMCRLYDLKRKVEVSRFLLDSHGKNNHSNCLDFGVGHLGEKNEYPALYISECTSPGRCFVEKVTRGKSTLVQTISFKKRVTSWFVDRDKRKLYAMMHVMNGWKMTDSISICKFDLPELSHEIVNLDETNIEDSFHLKVPYTLQGGTIHKNRLFLPVGTHGAHKDGIKKSRKLIVIDLSKRLIDKTINLEEVTDNEPEDVFFYKGMLWLFCGQSGGLYPIEIN